jgi:hypothetical protein
MSTNFSTVSLSTNEKGSRKTPLNRLDASLLSLETQVPNSTPKIVTLRIFLFGQEATTSVGLSNPLSGIPPDGGV